MAGTSSFKLRIACYPITKWYCLQSIQAPLETWPFLFANKMPPTCLSIVLQGTAAGLLKFFGSKRTGSSGYENLFVTEKLNFCGSHSKSEWFMKNFCRISRTPNSFTQTRESLHANDLIPQSYREETPLTDMEGDPKHWHFTMKNVKVKNRRTLQQEW